MTRLITAALIILAISVCSRGDGETITHNDQQKRSLSSKTYCPKDHNGKVPAEYCSSYVECTDGVQGDRHFCASGTKFDIVSQTCIWPSDLEVCEPYIAYLRGYTTDAYADGTNYCPDEYDGRAPVFKCAGYVTCEDGKYVSGAQCQYGTKFDTDTQMCVSTVKDCSLLVEVDETQMMEEMIQMQEATGTTTEEAERIVYPEECYGTFTGKHAIQQCTGYIQCQDGKEVGKYMCAEGLLFDRDVQLCNWAANVNCASSSPSMKPTAAPTTAAPTPWDPNNVYYPKFDKGVCVNDGNQGDVDEKYLFADIDKCCETYFLDNFEECSRVTPRPTNSPTEPKPKVWYPVYGEDTCKKDGQHSQYEVNFFVSYDECCEFDFMDTAACMENKPVYYANYDTNTCTNDGIPSAYEDMLYTSHSECCQNNEWIDSDTCISAGEGSMEQNSAGASTDMKYYPDYVNKKCKCDGKHSSTDTLFPSYGDCCNYRWINTEECMKHANECLATVAPAPSISSLDLWYPDINSNRCKNDGNNPDGVLTWTSYQVCCTRTMPGNSECEANSQASMIHKFYPQYFDSVCANDGNQPPNEVHLYDDIEECCKNGMYDFDYTTCINDYENV